MKAIVQDRYGSAEVLELRDIDEPTVGDDEVLIGVRAAGVDPSVWHLMTGQPYLVRLMGYGVRAPKLPVRGWDVAGVVEAVGRDVTRFRPGDEVFGGARGSFAEFAAAAERTLAPKPSNLTFEEAAAVPVSATTALQTLRDVGRLQPGQWVMVIGAGGGVGTFAVQLAKAFGARVTGVCSTSKLEMVRSLGADEVVDYTTREIDATGRRHDLVIDTAGNRPMAELRRAATPTGTVVVVGGEGGNRLTGAAWRLLTARLQSPFVSQRLTGVFAKERAEDLLVLKDLIERGDVKPMIDRTYPLVDAAEAIRRWEQGHARGKMVLTV